MGLAMRHQETDAIWITEFNLDGEEVVLEGGAIMSSVSATIEIAIDVSLDSDGDAKINAITGAYGEKLPGYLYAIIHRACTSTTRNTYIAFKDAFDTWVDEQVDERFRGDAAEHGTYRAIGGRVA